MSSMVREGRSWASSRKIVKVPPRLALTPTIEHDGPRCVHAAQGSRGQHF